MVEVLHLMTPKKNKLKVRLTFCQLIKKDFNKV